MYMNIKQTPRIMFIKKDRYIKMYSNLKIHKTETECLPHPDQGWYLRVSLLVDKLNML